MKRAVDHLDIAQLEDANAAALRRIWTSAKGSSPPKTFTARLMRAVLARVALEVAAIAHVLGTFAAVGVIATTEEQHIGHGAGPWGRNDGLEAQ